MGRLVSARPLPILPPWIRDNGHENCGMGCQRPGVGAGHLVRSRVLVEALLARGHMVHCYTNSAASSVQATWRDLPWTVGSIDDMADVDLRVVDGYGREAPWGQGVHRSCVFTMPRNSPSPLPM